MSTSYGNATKNLNKINTQKDSLAIVIDSYGSMSSIIRILQDQLKKWLILNESKFSKISIIYFGYRVHGPFSDINSLD